jgi:hypothetical protein
MKRTVLLHACCAPCSPNLINYLTNHDFDVTLFWFNPNIYPGQEHESRFGALRSYITDIGLSILVDATMTNDDWPDTPDRCEFCYRVRLEKTVLKAKQLNMSCFSTTLITSPYQKHDVIKQIAYGLAQKHGVEFVYEDLRTEYFRGKDIIRLKKLYLQKYCGCKYSITRRSSMLNAPCADPE